MENRRRAFCTSCATEPVTTSDSERSSIYRKLVSYRNVLENHIYERHFGIPNLFVPFITTTTRRMNSIMALHDKLLCPCKCCLFKVHLTVKSFAKAKADGHMLYEALNRVGQPPLAFVEKSNG